eukprot:3748989-Alexandrium_andersonii.AAC.1
MPIAGGDEHMGNYTARLPWHAGVEAHLINTVMHTQLYTHPFFSLSYMIGVSMAQLHSVLLLSDLHISWAAPSGPSTIVPCLASVARATCCATRRVTSGSGALSSRASA